MSKYPETSVDKGFGPIPSVKKKDQESFDDAMNKPNDPQKRYQPGTANNDPWNVTNNYDELDD